MTQDNYTEILVLVDRSGSMDEIKTDTEGGFNAFIREQRAIPGIARVSLAQFDNVFEWVYSGKLLDEVPNLNLQPRNSTALLDAMGQAIDEFGHRLSQIPEAARPGHVICVIMTDGLENASHKFTREQIMAKVAEQQWSYQWQFMYMGANQDAIAVGESMGVAAANSITYTGANAQAAWGATSAAVRNVRSAMPAGYTLADREEAVAEEQESVSASTGTNAAE